jgi:uncharacterized membrane protein YoaK (UPF0700 family)
LKSSKKMENILAILLTMTSGCADAISFLTLGGVLTAAMTGNTVFLGLSFVHETGLKPLGYVIALFGFMLGVAVGAVILKKRSHVTGLHPIVTSAICVELAAFVLFGILVSSGIISNQHVLVIILSFAMGVQGIAARRIGVNGVPTTVITSTTTGLIESLVWNVLRKGKADTDVKAASVPSSSIIVWVVDIVIYGVGAAVCGEAVAKWHMQAIWLPAVIVSVVVLSSVLFQFQVQQNNKLRSEKSISS